MTIPFPQKWANANPSRRVPTAQEIANGFPCGPADPDLFDQLQHRVEEVLNRLAQQMIYASDQRGVTWSESNEQSLFELLGTYEDIIKTDTVINVPADFDDIADVMDHLSNFRIANSATVIVNVAAGTYNHGNKVVSGHPDGLRIRIIGPALPSGVPTESAFQVSGSSAANIASDRIVNAAMLRARFPVVIQSSGTAIDVSTGSLDLQNILLLGSGAGAGVTTIGGVARMQSCGVHYYENNYYVERNGIISAEGCTSSGAAGKGFWCQNAGTILNHDGLSVSNMGAGYHAAVGGIILTKDSVAKGNLCENGAGAYYCSIGGTIVGNGSIADGNGDSGFKIEQEGVLRIRRSISRNNDGWGYEILNGGRMDATFSTSQSNVEGDYRAFAFGDMTITGYGGTVSASPALNAVGNGNAYIRN